MGLIHAGQCSPTLRELTQAVKECRELLPAGEIPEIAIEKMFGKFGIAAARSVGRWEMVLEDEGWLVKRGTKANPKRTAYRYPVSTWRSKMLPGWNGRWSSSQCKQMALTVVAHTLGLHLKWKMNHSAEAILIGAYHLEARRWDHRVATRGLG